jgi:hypothetical protein
MITYVAKHVIQPRFNALNFQKVVVFHTTSPSRKTRIISIIWRGMLFPQLYGKCRGITHKDGARPALFPDKAAKFQNLTLHMTVLGSNPRKPSSQSYAPT